MMITPSTIDRSAGMVDEVPSVTYNKLVEIGPVMGVWIVAAR
jgi:hypothetical protein